MDNFSTRIKALREDKGLSQSQLAKLTNISQAAISLWEDGQRLPNAEAIITMAQFFGVSTDYILGLAD